MNRNQECGGSSCWSETLWIVFNYYKNNIKVRIIIPQELRTRKEKYFEIYNQIKIVDEAHLKKQKVDIFTGISTVTKQEN